MGGCLRSWEYCRTVIAHIGSVPHLGKKMPTDNDFSNQCSFYCEITYFFVLLLPNPPNPASHCDVIVNLITEDQLRPVYGHKTGISRAFVFKLLFGVGRFTRNC